MTRPRGSGVFSKVLGAFSGTGTDVDYSVTAGVPFEALFESAPDAILVVNRLGVVVVANRQAEVLFGYTREELVGGRLDRLVPEAVRGRHPELRERFFEDPEVRPMGAGLRLSAVRGDGSEIPVDISLSPLRTDKGTLVSAAVRDITERRAQERVVMAAREDAEEANRAKTEFLSRMSHELRTPLTAILGFTELMQMDVVDEKQRRAFIDRTHKAGQHLLGLVNDVLDMSRVQSGNLSVSIESVSVRPLVEEAIALLGNLAGDRGITIENSVDPEAVAFADLNRVKQILLNLLSNAIKYNREDGLVEVRSSVNREGMVCVTVVDTGPGIPPEGLAKLFQPFERLGVTEVEGTGIGLALSRSLAEWMGGSISATSVVGEGSRFTLCLPRGERGDVAEPEERYEPAEASNAGVMLYVEDNPSNTVLVQSALSLRPNVRFLTAVQGQLGLDLARQNLPDLILLDLHLPDMSGEVVLTKLKADPLTRDIPVVVLSADATRRRIKAALDAGAARYMTKPFVIRDLLEVVDEAMPAAPPAD